VLLAAAGGLFVARGRLLGAHGNAAHAAPAPPPTAAPPASPSVAGPTTAAASAPTAAPLATAAPSAAPAASSAAPAASPPADWNACVTSQFAPHAFPGAASIDQKLVCSETDPRRGATALRSRVVLASADGRPTEAMLEWALLSWYEMAAFSVIRGRCCAAPPPLKLPPAIGSCQPLDKALDALGAAAAGQGDLEAAFGGVRKAVLCTVLSKGDINYNYKGRAPEGAESTLRKTLERKPPGR